MSRPDSSPGFFSAWFSRLDDENRSRLHSGRARIFLLCLLLIGLLSLALWPVLMPETAIAARIQPVIPWINLSAIVAVLVLLWSIWRVLLVPLLRLCNWADSMRAVNLDAQIEFSPRNDFAELCRDINMLGKMINQLSHDTEEQLEKHTDYISRESRSLSILYDVAWSINIAKDLNQMFDKTLVSLCSNLGASAGLVRQFNRQNQEISATQGEFNQTFLTSIDRFLPLQTDVATDSRVQHEHELNGSTVFSKPGDNADDPLAILSVPLQYRDDTLGMMHLFFHGDTDPGDEYNNLLHSIGQHLGNSIEKFRLLEEENQLLIMRERSHLSHELHDSLAQTLASLRIQLHLIADTLQSENIESGKQELENISFTTEQANKQLRELIAHFRVPMNKAGLISSIEEAIEQTGKDAGLKTYFQNDWPELELSQDTELNLLRIIQEGLANARKHSEANTVRIMLTCREEQLGLLIEDDGVGFDESVVRSEHGQRLGLSILKDRALQINASISIDSEPGEGTRISLQFRPER